MQRNHCIARWFSEKGKTRKQTNPKPNTLLVLMNNIRVTTVDVVQHQGFPQSESNNRFYRIANTWSFTKHLVITLLELCTYSTKD